MVGMHPCPVCPFITWWACLPPPPWTFTLSVSSPSDRYLEILYIGSKTWLATLETVALFTPQLRCERPWTITDVASPSMKERGALIHSRLLLSFPRWPEVKGGCFQKRRGSFKISARPSVLFAWLMSPWCRSSHLMYLRLLRTFRFVRFDWVWDLWGLTCKRCAPGLREPETVYLCLTRGNSL